MNPNSIKYRFFTQWDEKKPKIIGFFLVLFIGAILYYLSEQRYQILSKNIHNLFNGSRLFSIFFMTMFFLFFCILILLKIYAKSNGTNLTLNKLQKNEGEFQNLFQFSPVGSAIIDLKTGCFIAINNQFCDTLNYKPEEIKGRHISTIFPILFDSNSYYIEPNDNKNANGFSVELQLSTQYRKNIWVNLTISPSYEKEGKSFVKCIYIEDITSKKKQNLSQLIVNNFKVIVWEFDINTLKILFISEKIESILGYSATETMRKNNFWNELIHQNDLERVTNTIQLVIQGNITQEIVFRMIAKNKKTVWVKTIFNYEKERKTCLKVLMIDISNIKKVKKELKKMKSLVTEQNKKLINFSHIVSHNLRSHSSNIESVSSFISSTKSVTEQKQMIELLKSASISLNETVYDLNHVVNVKTKINLVYKTLNLKQYVISTENMLVDQIQSSNATIINLIPQDLLINYNPACLENILYNLLSNAIRFKHPERDPIITIKWINDKNKRTIEISDNGIGIDLKKNEGKIFGMYNTFHSNTKSKGMGLFTTKNQIEAMGGCISVESMVDIGTTFKINLR
jgi:PAS domain S-box-containing protein